MIFVIMENIETQTETENNSTQEVLEPTGASFKPTDEQISMGRQISSELADLNLLQTNMSIDPETSSLRFDVLLTKVKKIMCIFIFPSGEMEVDMYTASNVKPGDTSLDKERDLLYSKKMTLKDIKRELVFKSEKY